jgi:threonine dehydrogenase-like Zn-dependent dehydrogenase
VLTGGFPLVLDCIGSPESLRDALTCVRAQGAVVLVGNSGVVPRFESTWIWAKEIAILGSYFYAGEPARGGRHSIDLTLELLSGDAARACDRLVTHSFPLERYRDAVVANLDRAGARSIKTVFKPGGAA